MQFSIGWSVSATRETDWRYSSSLLEELSLQYSLTDVIYVIYKSCYDEKSEADYVLEQISNQIDRCGYDYKDFAILVRASVLTRSFEEKLALYNYPYRLIGGNKFFERKEVKDFLAYLQN